jgi:hypothetical protein
MATAKTAGAANPGTQTIQIRHALSCLDWVKHRQEARGGEIADQAWLLGYLSGIAVATRKNFLPATDSDSIFRWVDNYCRDHPLNDLNDAADDLAQELIRHKRL